MRNVLAGVLGLGEGQVRVIAPFVGGGFGPKIMILYPEEATLPWIAMRLNRPVKWIEDRFEHFVATTHERGQIHDAEIAIDDVPIKPAPSPNTIRVRAGRRKISALKRGYLPITRVVEVDPLRLESERILSPGASAQHGVPYKMLRTQVLRRGDLAREQIFGNRGEINDFLRENAEEFERLFSKCHGDRYVSRVTA